MNKKKEEIVVRLNHIKEFGFTYRQIAKEALNGMNSSCLSKWRKAPVMMPTDKVEALEKWLDEHGIPVYLGEDE